MKCGQNHETASRVLCGDAIWSRLHRLSCFMYISMFFICKEKQTFFLLLKFDSGPLKLTWNIDFTKACLQEAGPLLYSLNVKIMS